MLIHNTDDLAPDLLTQAWHALLAAVKGRNTSHVCDCVSVYVITYVTAYVTV